ncbi:unnamed protein product [Citrullus colocynthis]|uniref:Uncharacterized protein n=1 Tax=Citrullus colocynthis TaxID=252529 RepID=A0ABP0YNY8_9ROSI
MDSGRGEVATEVTGPEITNIKRKWGGEGWREDFFHGLHYEKPASSMFPFEGFIGDFNSVNAKTTMFFEESNNFSSNKMRATTIVETFLQKVLQYLFNVLIDRAGSFEDR